MTLPITWNDVLALGPIAVIFAGILLVTLVESFVRSGERWTFWLTLVVLVLAGARALALIGSQGLAFAGTVQAGGYAAYFASVFSLGATLIVLLSHSYLEKQKTAMGEYYILLLSAVLGMMVMAAANDFVVLFIGLETMSIPFYVLAGFTRAVPASNESSLKYFLLGAFATGFLLYGIALVYGTTGSTSIAHMRASLSEVAADPIFVIGLGLMITGFVFKVAAVPFHMWVPDVYEGAPTTVSGLMSTGGKAAALAALLVVFAPVVLMAVPAIGQVIALLAALSMVLGNIVAIAQSSIKRMLAYSSIAHAGYLLTGVVAGNDAGSNGVLFYLLAYTLMNIGAFGVIALLESAGIPPFAGFFGKYYVFAGAIEGGYTWLAILGVVMSVVSAYYYLRLVVVMYFQDGAHAPVPAVPRLGLVALIVSAIALLGLGVFPSTVVDVTSRFF
ncbi:MAG: nuoN [Bacteroidetes bacterium]|nr:nuoN [Bacteroidota bacterium]